MSLDEVGRLFWGKARPAPGAAHHWHSVLCHGLDVAAVGTVMLRRRPRLAARLAGWLGWQDDTLVRGLQVLLALHDVGKLTRPFQAKVPELWPTAILGQAPKVPLGDPGHGATGMRLLQALDAKGRLHLFGDGLLPSETELLLSPFLGHHGRPVTGATGLTDVELFGQARIVLDVGAAHVDGLCRLFGIDTPLPPAEVSARATWALAGLAAIADWIGSRQDWFPYTADSVDAEPYWHGHALPRAERAVEQAGIGPSAVRSFGGCTALLGSGREPSPLQSWAADVELPVGPLLILIEDVTGSGKTEAAIALAQRLMADGRAGGLAIALPTMATANAMFMRMRRVYRQLFEDGTRPSLALAHGRADLHPEFRQAAPIADGTRAEAAEQLGDGSAAECAAWLADDRRKAFLADVGVTTIDQAILAVLPAKHQPVRLLGLCERVLIVDEAHAYDAYVTSELASLLAAHAANGGSAIVLSATLPQAMRRKLAGAFAAALGQPALGLDGMAYPMAAVVAGNGVVQVPQAVRPDLIRRVGAERLPDAESALTAVAEAARRGAAVAWIRNTVDDVLDAAGALKAARLVPLVFHARFALCDRLRIEAAVMERFGPASEAEQRRGVLVCSQVLQESLDVDLDLVVTDLAPVDLLLQRMGRLWRHPRRNPYRPIGGPRLLVVSSEPADEPAVNWIAGALPGTSRVYADHALLWRSARALFRRGEVCVPEDVRALVEEVYAEGAAVPDALAGAADRVRGQASAQTWLARTNVLDFDKGYAPDSGQWAAEHMIPTRDAEEQVTFRLGRIESGRIVPWAADGDFRQRWALSEVKVRRSRADVAQLPPKVSAAMEEEARGAWPEYERSMPLLVLTRWDDVWRGVVLHGRQPVAVSYHEDEGLRFSANPR